MFTIKTCNQISKAGLSKFNAGKYTVSDTAENPDAILVRSASLHDAGFPASLLAISRAGAGVNNIPVEKCSEQGVVVFNTPGANANAVKELVICMLIASARGILPAAGWALALSGHGPDVPRLVEKGKSQFTGPEIYGKTLGVIGLGAIGVKVANAAESLGMDVYGYDPYLSIKAAWGLSRTVRRAANISEIYEKSDFITIHVPLNNETRDTIDNDAIAQMKDGVRLLNFARGGLVVDNDIVVGLKSGRIAAYATDFPSDALLGVKGVLGLPHLGASTPESEDNCAIMAANEMIDYLENGNITNSVNYPNVEMPRSGETRITVIHKNIPSMLSTISSAFSSENINIDNLVNKSRNEYAYTILDVTGGSIERSVEKLTSSDGVIRTRVIR